MDFQNEGFGEKLLSAFQRGDETVGEIIDQHLSEENISYLLEWFERCSHGDRDEIVPLLKMLVSFPRTRGRTITRCIQLIQKNIIVGKVRFHCMTEIHLGIMQYASSFLPLQLNPFQDRNDYSQRSSDPSNQPNTHNIRKTIAELEEFVEILLSSTFSSTNSKEDGCLVVLDLLATIVNCMKSIEFTDRENDSNSEIQHPISKSKSVTSSATDIISQLLKEKWSPPLVPVLTNVLSELKLNEKQAIKLLEKIKESANVLMENDFPTIIKQSITIAQKCIEPESGVQAVQVLRYLLSRAPSKETANICFIIELALQHSSSTGQLIISSFEFLFNINYDKKKSQSFQDSSQIQLSSSDIVLLLLVAGIEILREKAFATISTLLFTSKLPLSQLESILSEFIKKGGMDMRSHLVLELGLVILDFKKNTKSAAFGVKLGEHLLVELFISHPSSRLEVLGTAFNAISEEANLQTKEQFVSILEKICTFHIHMLNEYLNKIQEWLSYLPNFQVSISKRILLAFLPLTKFSGTFFDNIWMLLQKLLVSRHGNSRILAVYGMCSLLSSPITRDKLQIDVISALKPAFGYSLDVREHLFDSLSFAVSEYGEQSLLPETLAILTEIVLLRLRRYFKAKPGKLDQPPVLEFSLLRMFEDVGGNLEPRPREVFGHLLQTAIYLLPFTPVVHPLNEMISTLGTQFRDIHGFIQLSALHRELTSTTEKPLIESPVHSSNSRFDVEILPECDSSKVSVLQRIAFLLPVYQILTALNFQVENNYEQFLNYLEMGSILHIIRDSTLTVNQYQELNGISELIQNSYFTEKCFLSLHTIVLLISRYTEFLKSENLHSDEQNKGFPTLEAMAYTFYLLNQKLNSDNTMINAELLSKLLTDIFIVLSFTANFENLPKVPSPPLQEEIIQSEISHIKIGSEDVYDALRNSLLQTIYTIVSVILPRYPSYDILRSVFRDSDVRRLNENILKQVIPEWEKGPQKLLPCHIAVIFAKQMCDEIKTETGCPDYIVYDHMRIIEYVLQSNGTALDEIKTTSNKIVQLFESILRRYKLKQAPVVRTLLKFVLGTISSVSEVNLYLECCLSHSRDKEEDENSNEESENEASNAKKKSLQLCASGHTQSASLQLIIAKYDAMLSEMDMKTILGIIQALNKIISSKSTIQSPVNAKLLSLTWKLLTSLAKLCKDERLDTKKLPEGVMSVILSKESSLKVLVNAKKLISNKLSKWLERGKESFCGSNAKKIPGLIFKVERFELELDRLLDANKNIDGFSSVERKFRKVEKEVEQTEVQLVSEEVTSKRGFEKKVFCNISGKRKRKIRSRNSFVDAFLEEESGSDTYADLEDFVVYKKGRVY